MPEINVLEITLRYVPYFKMEFHVLGINQFETFKNVNTKYKKKFKCVNKIYFIKDESRRKKKFCVFVLFNFIESFFLQLEQLHFTKKKIQKIKTKMNRVFEFVFT